jgi:hypothetical protein
MSPVLIGPLGLYLVLIALSLFWALLPLLIWLDCRGIRTSLRRIEERLATQE